MTGPEVISLIRDIVVAAAAVVAGIVGILGLTTWRRQARANTEYQLAKSILTSLYELRDAVARVRSPLMQHAAEPDLPKEKLENLTKAEKQWHALEQAYQKRWDPIPPAKARLDTNVWEAQVIFGEDISTNVHEFTRLLGELLWAIETHLEERHPSSTDDRTDDHALVAERRRILFAFGDDEFKKKRDAAIAEVERQLRPCIARFHRV